MADEMILCPHCGKENLPTATRCVYCGQELEQLFKIEGLESTPLGESNPGTDLPNILKAFREEERQGAQPSEPEPAPTQPDQTVQLPESEPAQPESSEPQVPDWLARIRTRAAEEEDASGDLARRAGSRDQVRAGNKGSDLDQEFSSWIERLRESKQQENLLNARKAAEESQNPEATPEWLRKIRELQPEAESLEETQPVENTAAEESTPAEQASQPESSSEITQPLPEAVNSTEEAEGPQTKAIEAPEPEVVLPEEPTTPPETAASLEPSASEAGLQPEVSGSTEAPGAAEAEVIPPDLLLLRKQKERAEVLRNLIAEEGKTFPPHTSKPTSKSWYRLVIGFILLAALIGTLIFVPAPPAGEGALPAPALALQENLEALAAGDKVLVVLDYQPATSFELEQMAVPTLQFLTERGVTLELLTTQPSGLWLAQRLTSAAGLTPAPQAAYLPGGILGIFAFAVEPNQTSALLPATLTPLANYRAILLLEDSGSQFQAWMEQAAPWLGKGRFLVLQASQDAAIVLPYYDAGQVAGFAAGAQEGAGLARALGQEPEVGLHWRALQVGLLILIILLVVGMVSKAEKDSAGRHVEEQA